MALRECSKRLSENPFWSGDCPPYDTKRVISYQICLPGLPMLGGTKLKVPRNRALYIAALNHL